MLDPISLIVAGMHSDMQRINIVANNAANALTPGFKREIAAVSGSGPLAGPAVPQGVTGATLPLVTSTVDPSQGVMKQTGRMLDLAVSGTGFFEVSTPTGVAYTRHGAFRLDSDGRLVTQEGYPVSGQSGEIRLDSAAPLVDRGGRILVDGVEINRLRVVNLANATALQSIGGGLFVAPGGVAVDEVTRPNVFQGQLEGSNVDSTAEMVRLMEIYRHFEASSRVLQAYGDLKESTFTSLGNF